MGGGTSTIMLYLRDGRGLSPRGRGNRRHVSVPHFYIRSIPAWAGEPFWGVAALALLKVYPRVGGGTTSRLSIACCRNGLSPRGRGNLVQKVLAGDSARSIPAWAGEPGQPIPCPSYPRVYPRVGGGTPLGCAARPVGYGLSPRGRGNLDSP